jgi:Putative zinc-finger
MSREKLRRLAQRELTPREIAETLRHIGECEECARIASAGLGPDLDALQASLTADDGGPWHPDHSELVAYADGVAGPAEREIVESHLDDCPLCRTDVADLARLRRTRPRRPMWRAALLAAAAAAIAVIVFLQRSDNPPSQPSPPPVVTTQPPPTTTTAAPTVTSGPEPVRYARPEWKRLVDAALATATLPFPREVALTPDALRGPSADARVRIAPVGVIDETRPRFSWPERAGSNYAVSVFANEEPVAHSEPLTATHWTPPTALLRGRTYAWQVRVMRDGASEIIPAPPAPPAMFRIVSARDHDELAEARRLHPDDLVLHAVLAARAGLREEAEAALRSAKATGQTKKLLDSLQ